MQHRQTISQTQLCALLWASLLAPAAELLPAVTLPWAGKAAWLTTLLAFPALRAGEGQAAEDLLGGQLAFLRDHLLRWIAPFAADACASAETGFYAHLATFTETYLKADESALDEVVG